MNSTIKLNPLRKFDNWSEHSTKRIQASAEFVFCLIRLQIKLFLGREVINYMNTIFTICLFLTFKFVDGNECAFPADDLSISVENQTLQLKSSEVNVTLSIKDLASMRFTDSPETGISQLDSDSALEVYSLKGESVGLFQSFYDLKKSLPTGTYIIRQGKNSIKISI